MFAFGDLISFTISQKMVINGGFKTRFNL